MTRVRDSEAGGGAQSTLGGDVHCPGFGFVQRQPGSGRRIAICDEGKCDVSGGGLARKLSQRGKLSPTERLFS